MPESIVEKNIKPDIENALAAVAESSGNDGTQAIRRAVAILRIIATRAHPGITMGEISEVMKLSRSTTHRILKCLVSEGLAAQDDHQFRYSIGPLVYELSLSVSKDFHSAARWYQALDQIAQLTGHTSYLMVQTGLDVVCIRKAEGTAILRAVSVEVGQRRPLGVGAGALALLASHESDEITRIVTSLTPAYAEFKKLTPQQIINDALVAKDCGYSVSRGKLFEGVIGVAVALPIEKSRLAVSVVAPAQTTDDEMVANIARIIKREVARTIKHDGKERT